MYAIFINKTDSRPPQADEEKVIRMDGRDKHNNILQIDKFFNAKASLIDNSAEKTSFAKFMDYFRWFKGWKPAHFSTGTGIFTSSLRCGFVPMVRFFGSESLCSM